MLVSLKLNSLHVVHTSIQVQYAAVISLINVFNLSGPILSDTGDPLVTLTQAPIASAAATSTVSRPPPQWTLTVTPRRTSSRTWRPQPFDQASTSQTTSKSSRKRDKRRREEECQEEEDTWMRDLRAIMKPTKPSWRSLWRRALRLTVSRSYGSLLTHCCKLPKSSTK